MRRRTTGKVGKNFFLENVNQCYSLRRAQRDYTGNCGVIKRMSDGQTLTVGFDSNNELDKDAVDAFDDGSDLRLIEWFNQGVFNFPSVFNLNDSQCPLLKRNGDYINLNGKIALEFEAGCKLFRSMRMGTIQNQILCAVYAGKVSSQDIVGITSINASNTVASWIRYSDQKNRAYKQMASNGTEFQEHSLEVPFGNQQISSMVYVAAGRFQNVNNVIESSPRQIFLGSDWNNHTTINAAKPLWNGAPSLIQEVMIGGAPFDNNIVEQANKYYQTF